MTKAGPPPPSFLEGAVDHFAEFTRNHADAEEIVVRITFSDNRTLELDGFRVTAHPTRPNCFLGDADSPESKLAVVIRNDHVFKIEFGG